MQDGSPDHDERLKDFFARHGGRGSQASREEDSADGIQGWSEVYACDGYTLRCEWSKIGSNERLSYSEIAP